MAWLLVALAPLQLHISKSLKPFLFTASLCIQSLLLLWAQEYWLWCSVGDISLPSRSWDLYFRVKQKTLSFKSSGANINRRARLVPWDSCRCRNRPLWQRKGHSIPATCTPTSYFFGFVAFSRLRIWETIKGYVGAPHTFPTHRNTDRGEHCEDTHTRSSSHMASTDDKSCAPTIEFSGMVIVLQGTLCWLGEQAKQIKA
jgi:hypothetical protein